MKWQKREVKEVAFHLQKPPFLVGTALESAQELPETHTHSFFTHLLSLFVEDAIFNCIYFCAQWKILFVITRDTN